jgi:hypothetical protein
MYNTPIIKNRFPFTNRTSLSFRKSYDYSIHLGNDQNPFIDEEEELLRLGDLGITNRWSASENLALTFTTDVVEVGVRGNVNYNGSENSLNNYIRNETWNWTWTGNLNLHLPYSINIANDINYTAREGYSSYTRNELVWNASIDKTVFKNQGVVSLRLYDILHQRQNVFEDVQSNYRQLSQSNTLTSYVMLSFTYRIMKFGGNTSAQDMFRGRIEAVSAASGVAPDLTTKQRVQPIK